jgi:hypothetical protein
MNRNEDYVASMVGTTGSGQPIRSPMDRQMQQEFNPFYPNVELYQNGTSVYGPRSQKDISLNMQFNPYFRQLSRENYNTNRTSVNTMSMITDDPYNTSGNVKYVPLS